ncbi:helix-turn-helix domain-containing protein [Kitasatospora sp. NPDC058046]|uniref:AraC-like ligand-binding domain-containing protein n=1 Tax=Kitasatospora sp. NPDC058046 TaxID=3346312 RepID=UPI0036DF81B5
MSVVPSAVLDTAGVPAADRAEYWHEAVSRTFIPLDVVLREDAPAPATITSHRLGAAQVSLVRAGPQRVERSARLIARGGEDHLTLALQHRGTARLLQDGRQVELRPGTFAISDAGRPFSKDLPEPFLFTAFHWPRSAVGVTEEDLRVLTATAFDTREDDTARLVGAYLDCLSRSAGSMEPPAAAWLATTALDLLAVLAHERRGRSVPEAPEAALATLARLKDHILRHLGDPELSPERIAEAHHVSVRYLHKLFGFEGVTVTRWIRRQRLDACRRDLARAATRTAARPATGPTGGPATVAAVAGRWGFVSASHFSRAFRAAYGVSPREWQACARAGLAQGGAARPEGYGIAV